MNNERIPPSQRPTIAQMRAQSNGEGWECARCGCCDWRVVDSRQYGTVRRRVRACRHCHHVIRTTETLDVSGENSGDSTGSLPNLGVHREDHPHDESDDSRRNDRTGCARTA